MVLSVNYYWLDGVFHISDGLMVVVHAVYYLSEGYGSGADKWLVFLEVSREEKRIDDVTGGGDLLVHD